MREVFLGDSYDLVKRFWRESLDSIGPLYAHPRFIPLSIRKQFTAVTTIPILGTLPKGHFGILLDPDTGVPLPSKQAVRRTAKHAPLTFIVGLNVEMRPDYLICFDQSYHRLHELDRKQQRAEKGKFLAQKGLSSFYYVSHAPFLFVASQPLILRNILDRLVSLGIPKDRLELPDLLAA
ncbi:hypothetical protein SBA7_860002 [Candidatus Sulfotelmatobacter sp. SbA7]|jgi:hypothetical protein|nr:hypothetical protein SBA7_860002 [Candidatus Sulfotelmatobacter sp. SbA7]